MVAINTDFDAPDLNIDPVNRARIECDVQVVLIGSLYV